MAGEDLDQIWRDMCQWNGDLMMDASPMLHRYGAACAAEGCQRCTNPDCPYADFIRHYWNHPRCD